jgi:hypothetical protein
MLTSNVMCSELFCGLVIAPSIAAPESLETLSSTRRGWVIRLGVGDEDDLPARERKVEDG